MTSLKKANQCNILNYIRRRDLSLYELIYDMCLHKNFSTRKNPEGITFLFPTDDMVNELTSDYNNNTDLAKEKLNSLIISGYSATAKSLSNSVLYTFVGMKINVKGTHEKADDFNSSDKLAVFNVTQFPTIESMDQQTNSGKSMFIGGADFRKLTNRKLLFESIVKSTILNGSEPAMEFLVEVHKFTLSNKELSTCIASLLSYDVLTSLAIILQPYKKTYTYLDDQTLEQVKNNMPTNNAFISSANIYGITKNCAIEYENIMRNFSLNNRDLYKSINSANDLDQDQITAVNVINSLKRVYGKFNGIAMQTVPSRAVNPELMLCEAELRVLAAVLNDRYDYQSNDYLKELLDLYQKCDLNEPYMFCNSVLQNAPPSFHISCTNLIISSDAIFYLPNIKGSKLKEVVNNDSSTFISINSAFKDDPKRMAARNKSQDTINRLYELFK